MSAKQRKSRFTASVRENLVQLVDEQANKMALTRSDAIEQAMEMWLLNHAEAEEEAYFQAAAKEMNADAKDWTTLTSNSFRKAKE